MKGQLDVRAKTSSGTSATFNDVLVSRASDDIHVGPSVMAFGQALWGNDYGWGGRLQRGENYSPPAVHYIPLVAGRAMPVYARFWLIEMADTSNKAGFLDFSKLILSPAFQPAVNLSFNWQIEWVDPSPTSRARGGQVYTDPRRRYRRLSFSFENQQTLEAFSHLYELDRVQGKTSPILAVVAPSDAANLHRTSIYGSMPELPGLRNTFVDRYAKDIVIEEWL
jgi:hypothetical protein